ncbi:MAG TPA: HAD-IA family hydrolase [Thermoanaerobaculia bacterium]|nr:HAD-IA family hydrolase [Thermoanaerobaculia bacterium]
MRAVFFDAGDTLLRADPPVEEVYRGAFARYGVRAQAEEVHAAVHATWRDVDLARERGEERWGGAGGEAGFWRRFVGTVFTRVGGGAMPEPLLGELVAHFGAERHWAVYPETRGVLAALRAAGLRLVIVSNWDSTLPSLLERLGLAAAVDDVVVSALLGVSKPARGIFDEAVRRAGVTHAEALHVGDSLTDDYHGARDAGLSSLLLDRRGRAREGVEAISSLDEVPRRVLAR